MCIRLVLIHLLSACLFVIAPFSPAFAVPRAANQPRICLVLKGGGALGFAHVGVLKVLERNRVPVHCIAGTSMGSIVGAAYASGNKIEDLERILNTTDWDELFGENINRETRDFRLKPGRNREIYGDAKLSVKDGKLSTPTGIIQGQNIRPLFQDMFGDLPSPIEFDSLPVPFRAVTADIETGQKYVPSKGDLATIVRASMSVPGAFAAVEVDNHLLVDGGIANNLPVEVALKMGADVLIVVDLISELAKRQDLSSPISISGQMISLLLLQNSAASRALVRPQDVVIEPNVSAYTAVQFAKGPELMKIGEDTANAMVDSLRKLSISEEDYRKYIAARTAKRELNKNLDFIRIKSDSHLSEDRIAKNFRLKEGDRFDRKVIEEDVQKLYQSGYFQTVQYTIVRDGEKEGLEINVKEKEWLNSFYRLGFSLEDNLDGDDAFRLAVAYRQNTTFTTDGYIEGQFEIGKSPRISAELFQPIGSESPYFINPIIGVTRNELRVRQDDEDIAEYSRSEAFSILNFGRKLGTVGELAVGVTRAGGSLDREIGDPVLQEFGYDIGDFSAGFDIDTLDKPDFPTVGYGLNSKYRVAVDALGASDEFGDISGGAVFPFTFDRNTVGFRVDYAHTFGVRPIERSYSLGGFGTISGFDQSSLVASNYVTGQLIGFRRFSEVANPLFDLAFFLGASLEFTNIENDNPNFEDENLITSGSIFFGADTPISPLYLGFGAADTGDQSIYLMMGRLGRGKKIS